MLIHFKKIEPSQVYTARLCLAERLPFGLTEPIRVICDYHIQFEKDFYLLSLDVKGSIRIACQRCLADFYYDYDKRSEIAIGESDAACDRLMATYDVIMAEKDEIDLATIVTDELHLYLPVYHDNSDDCDKETLQYLNKALDD